MIYINFANDAKKWSKSLLNPRNNGFILSSKPAWIFLKGKISKKKKEYV